MLGAIPAGSTNFRSVQQEKLLYQTESVGSNPMYNVMVAYWSPKGKKKTDLAFYLIFISMIKLKDILQEGNQGLWNWYKQQLPDWPDYVINDLFFSKLNTSQDLQDKKEHVNNMKQMWKGIKWKFEKLHLNFDSFSKETQDTMKQRQMGKANPNQVPDDEKRHQTQSNLIKKRGISKQPIILIKNTNTNGYELIEGWHRTMQYLNHFPEGYTCPAWVGYL
jgi:hypothetical protein